MKIWDNNTSLLIVIVSEKNGMVIHMMDKKSANVLEDNDIVVTVLVSIRFQKLANF